MKRFRDGLMTAVLVVGLMGFLGNNVLGPVSASAEEKKAEVKKEAAVKDDKAAKEEKATKKSAPAKKAKKKGPPPVVTVAEHVIQLAPAVQIDIIGTGFEPNQELRILYTDAEGMQTDIGYALVPEVKTNNSGAFFTTWNGAEFVKAKLLTPGAKTLTVTNSEFKPLAETNVNFKVAPKAAKAPKGDKKDDKKDGGEKKEKKDDGEKKEKKKKAE